MFRFLFNVSSCHFSYGIDRVYELKTIRITFLILIILKSYEYLNELAGCCVFVESNKYEYIITTMNTFNSYFITP